MELNDGTQPLPDSDLTLGVDTEETASTDAAQSDATTEKKASRQWSHNDSFVIATMTVKDGELTGSTDYDISGLPEVSRAYLAYVGLTVFMSRADDVTKHFDKLTKGEGLGVRGNGKTAAPKRDFWREAIALALVDATKKHANPLTVETATERAKGYDKAAVKGLKHDTGVIKHFNKLSGGTIGYSIAGLLAKENEVL